MARKIYYSITEASEFLGVHPETLRRWDRNKKLPAEKINDRGDRRYDLDKLKRFKEMVKLATDDEAVAKEEIKKSLSLLEENAENAKYMFAIGDSFRVPRDLAYYILEDEGQSNHFQALLNAFNFEIKGDELKSKMSGTDGKGEFWSFPNLSDFKKTDLNYLRKVLPTYKHPRLKARIAHILWATEKDPQMALLAIENYLAVVRWLNTKIKEDAESASAFEIPGALECAYIMAKKIKQNLESVNKLLAETILNFDNRSESRYAVTIRLIKFAFENKNDYGKNFWENAIKISQKMAEELEAKNNSYFARDFLSLGGKIQESVFGLKDNKWKKSIAVSYEGEAKKRDDSFVQSELLVKAITEYKELGDKNKVSELEQVLGKAKKNMKFQTFEQSLDLTDWVKQIRSRFKLLASKESSEQLFARVASDQSIIPKYDEIKKQSEKLDKEFPMQALFSHSIIDLAGNEPRKYESEEEKKYISILKQMHFHLVTGEVLVKVLFEELLDSKKIDLDSTLKFITNHLWFGGEYEEKDPDTGNIILKHRRWVETLRPGLTAYFLALDSIANKNSEMAGDQLVLAVDSLTPKIEGLIREFYSKIGKNTAKIKIERNGKRPTEEKGLDELLREPYAEEIFGADLILLMKYVLIELAGYNLRNNVSHAFLFRRNYLLIYAHWIFIIILRIGAYQFSIKPKEN